MTAIFMAMFLTGAGGLAEAQDKPPLYPVPTVIPPPPPLVVPPPAGVRPDPAPPQRARANLNAYFSVDDYPAAALRARHQGATGFALTIGADGRVTNCQVTMSSGSAPIDETTCRVLRARARYNPARTADGTPTTGRDSGRVTWRLPDERIDRAGLAMAYVPANLLTLDARRMTAADVPPGAPPPTDEGISGLRVAVGRDGQVIGCDIDSSSGSPALDAAACRLFSARARFEPGRTPAGAAVCDISWTEVRWTEAAAMRPPAPPGRPAAAAQPPRPLREQLNASLCPGWSMAGSEPPPLAAPPGVAPRLGPPPQRMRANLNSYFSTDDYPAVSLLYHHEGTTVFELTVGVDGRVTDCRIRRSSGAVPLDQATCRILRSRGRYLPARAANGTPVEGSDSGRVTWRLPEDWGRAGLPMTAQGAHLLNRDAVQMTAAELPAGAPPPPTGARAELRVAVGLQGQVIGCDISRSSGSPAFDAAACRHYAARARFEPARDPAGALMCDVVWLSSAWPTATPNSQPAQGTSPAVPPLPLRQQIRASLCPGWPANGALR